MDRRPIRQILAQIITEFFLCAAANRDDHMRRAMPLNQRKKISVFDFQSVPRRDITILAGSWKRFPARPIEQFLSCAFAGKDPENFSGPLPFQLAQQMFQILQTRRCVRPSRAATSARAEPSNHCRQSPDQPRVPRADTSRPRAIEQNKFPTVQSEIRRAETLNATASSTSPLKN